MCRVQSARGGGGVKKFVSFLLHTDQIFQEGSIKFFVRGIYPPPPLLCTSMIRIIQIILQATVKQACLDAKNTEVTIQCDST